MMFESTHTRPLEQLVGFIFTESRMVGARG